MKKNLLADLLDERHMSPEDLANAVGRHKQVIYHAMGGKRRTRKDTLEAIVRVLASRGAIDDATRAVFLRTFPIAPAPFDIARAEGDRERQARIGNPGVISVADAEKAMQQCVRRLDAEAAMGLARLVVAMATMIEQAEIRGRSAARVLHPDEPCEVHVARPRARAARSK